jgi:hypothetical protein
MENQPSINTNTANEAPSTGFSVTVPPEIVTRQEPTAEELAAQRAARIAELEGKNAEQAAEIESLRISKATAEARKPTATLNLRQDDMLRDKLVAACGGNARYFAQDATARCAARGVPDSNQYSNKQCAEIFGPGSDSQRAAQLAKSNPQLYRKLRIIAQERGIY